MEIITIKTLTLIKCIILGGGIHGEQVFVATRIISNVVSVRGEKCLRVRVKCEPAAGEWCSNIVCPVGNEWGVLAAGTFDKYNNNNKWRPIRV